MHTLLETIHYGFIFKVVLKLSQVKSNLKI